MYARLAVVLGLVAAAAGVVSLTPSLRECPQAAALDGLPATLGRWTGVDGISDRVLPMDPSETVAVRRTYHDGPRIASISVALFTRQDEPRRRASINRIYPEKDVSRVEPVAGSPVAAVVISGPDRRFLVAYWHQIGNRAYAGESRFRLALMREVLFARRGNSVLVRMAIPVGAGGISDALATVGELTPLLREALTGRAGC